MLFCFDPVKEASFPISPSPSPLWEELAWSIHKSFDPCQYSMCIAASLPWHWVSGLEMVRQTNSSPYMKVPTVWQGGHMYYPLFGLNVITGWLYTRLDELYVQNYFLSKILYIDGICVAMKHLVMKKYLEALRDL